MMKKTTKLLLAAILLTSFIAAVPVITVHAKSSVVLFVSPSGSDAIGTGSLASPYATISHAIAVAANGSTISVEPGIYDEMVNITKSLTLESASGQPSNTIINAAGKSFGIWIKGPSASGTIIEGLTVENANSHGIYVEDTSYILIENNQVLHNTVNPFPACPAAGPPTGPCVETQTGIEMDGTSFSTIASNTISETVGDGGIALHSDSTVLNPGALLSGANSTAVGNVIMGNTIIGNLGGCGIVISSFDAGETVSDNIVSNNVVIDNAAGVIVATNGPFQLVTNTTVTNNILLNNLGPGFVIVNVASTISGTSFTDNTVAGNAAPGLPATSHPTGISMAAVAIPHLPPPLTSGTAITGNTIRDEYFGIFFGNNTVGTTVTQNTIDPSVSVPLTGVIATGGQLTTISNEVGSIQANLNLLHGIITQLESSVATSSSVDSLSSTVSSLNSTVSSLQSNVNSLLNVVNNTSGQVSTLSAVSYAALIIAVVLGLIAIVFSMRKRG